MQRALQGVTYWIGHRRCLYRDYPLSEGALVAEVCNLIHSNLPDQYVLLCEVQYSTFAGREVRRKFLRGRVRADLVVAEKAAEPENKPVPRFIIEVKRASAPKSQIDGDICRLAEIRDILPNVRSFLFVIAEATRPRRFVNEDGQSILGKHRIGKQAAYYRVRRTLKAAHAYTKRDRAQYASLIEVYAC